MIRASRLCSLLSATSICLLATIACERVLGAEFDPAQIEEDAAVSPDAGWGDAGLDAPAADSGAECAVAADCRGGPCLEGKCIDLVSIAAGGRRTCAVLSDGSVWCWGEEAYEAPSFEPYPVRIAVAATVTAVAVGDDFSCALSADHEVWCWGRNAIGQLGTGVVTAPGPTSGPWQPTRVVGLSDVVAIHAAVGGAVTAGGGQHACARKVSGEYYCWGSNVFGELGRPLDQTYVASAAHDPELDGASAVILGFRDTCRIVGGTLSCRGESGFGDAAAAGVSDPSFHEVKGFELATLGAIGAGFIHARFANGAHGWGRNDKGQLCNGSVASEPSDSPVPSLLSGFSELGAGGSHVCVRTAAGLVQCCGSGDKLGPGLTSGIPTPNQIQLDGTAVQLSVGADHSCAIVERDDRREAVCWGTNSSGQLGIGSTFIQVELQPVQWLTVD